MHSKESRSYIAHTRLEAILETAVDAIISINSVGIIDTFNPAAEKLFGYSTDEVIGKNINILMVNQYILVLFMIYQYVNSRRKK